jgi:hypothetical protein
VSDWFKILGDIVELTFKTVRSLLKLIDAMGGLENAVIGTVGVLVGLQAVMFTVANPLAALVIGLTAGATAFTLFADEALKAQRAQQDFGNEVGTAISLSKREVKAFSGAVFEDVFFGKKLSKDVIETLAGSSTVSLESIFKDVGGSIIAQSQRRGFKDSKSRLLSRLAAVRGRIVDFKIKEIEVPREAAERRRKGITRFRANQDRLDREAAAEASFKRLRNIGDAGRGGAGSKKEDGFTQEEVFKLIEQAARSGQSLTGLIGRRNIPGGVPPVIAMRIFSPQINQENQVVINVEGGEDFSAGELREEIITTLEAREQTNLREALEALQPAEAV